LASFTNFVKDMNFPIGKQVIVRFFVICCEMSVKVAAYVLRLAAGGEIEFRLPGTVAKFINKSSLFILSLNRVFSAGTTAQ